MPSLSGLKYHTGRVDSTVLSAPVRQHLSVESYCPQFIIIIFLRRIMDADWEVLKVQIKDTCLESCTTSWNIKLFILRLQLYVFGKLCPLLQKKLAECNALLCTWLTMPGYSDTREDKVTLSAAVQYTGSNREKWHSNYKGNAYEEISVTTSSIVLRRGRLHCKDPSQLRFLLALATVMCSPPALPHRYW